MIDRSLSSLRRSLLGPAWFSNLGTHHDLKAGARRSQCNSLVSCSLEGTSFLSTVFEFTKQYRSTTKMSSSASRIEYSEKYADDMNEYRYVVLGVSNSFRHCASFPSSETQPCNPSLSCVMIFYSHVILPKELAKTLPKSRLLSESEWRGIGVQQSRGWQHYAIHRYVRFR